MRYDFFRVGDMQKSSRKPHGLAKTTAFLLVMGFMSLMVLLVRLSLVAFHLPVPDLPSLQAQNRGIALFDRRNKYFMTLHKHTDCYAIPYSEMSKNIVNAAIAIEDHNFFYHCGIDLQSIARAFRANRQAGQIVQGGSTITQQLVRNLYLDPADRSYSRKMKEALLAWVVERQNSKEKILETYLNESYFGNGVSGIERAAEFYFAKPASKLAVPEAAFLAGLLRAPSSLGDPRNRNLALERERIVIDKMEEYGFLSPLQAQSARTTHLEIRTGKNQREQFPYYVSYLLPILRQELGNQMWTRGWRVYTTLDIPAQRLAEKVMNQELKHAPSGIDQGALITMDIDTGDILAMLGGIGKYENSQWNRAIYPHTAGSSFKPFVYLAGLAYGLLQPDTLINDSPIEVMTKGSPPYIPKNFDDKFLGWIPVRDALAKSRNICSVRVAVAVGLDKVIDVARAAGIRSRLDPYPSLALGACAVSPLEMTGAYATFARGGAYLPPQMVRHIDDETGHLFKSYSTGEEKRIVSQPVLELVDIMQDVVKRGTGRAADIAGLHIAGKTGTADESRDIWFIGFTPKIITTVWAGNDANEKVRGNVTGGSLMAGIWRKYMVAFNRLHPLGNAAFPAPESRFADSTKLNGNPILIDGSTIDENTKQFLERKSAEDLKQMQEKGIARASDMRRAEATERMVNPSGRMPLMQQDVDRQKNQSDSLDQHDPNQSGPLLKPLQQIFQQLSKPLPLVQPGLTSTPPPQPARHAAQPSAPQDSPQLAPEPAPHNSPQSALQANPAGAPIPAPRTAPSVSPNPAYPYNIHFSQPVVVPQSQRQLRNDQSPYVIPDSEKMNPVHSAGVPMVAPRSALPYSRAPRYYQSDENAAVEDEAHPQTHQPYTILTDPQQPDGNESSNGW